MELSTILSMVDHTLLKPESTWAQIRQICDDAMTYHTATVCIPASYVRRCKAYMAGNPDAVGVCLVKPQFEAGREKVGKKGVVRDPATHREVLKMAEGYAMANHFTPAGLDFSPIKGPEGNIEFLLFVQHCETPQPLPDGVIEQVVAAAHAALDKTPNLH